MSITVADLALPVDAAAVRALLPTLPRLLALGEPTHGSQVVLRHRNSLFAELVEQQGYRTIALESDCLAGLLVDDFVTGGDGDLEDVVQRGISHDFGAYDGNRELVQWMRAFNDGRPDEDQVHFAGFDGPLEMAAAASPQESFSALYDYLAARVSADLLPCSRKELTELLGADELWTEPAAMRDPSRSFGQSSSATRLRVIADDLTALLAAHAAGLVGAPGWDLAQLQARTAVGLLRYHHWMADSSDGRVTRLVGERDSMMAANLLALADRGPTLVFAHNAHLQRDLSSMQFGRRPVQWWSAGALAEARLHDDYRFLAMTLGTFAPQVAEAPSAESIEGLLQGCEPDAVLIDPQQLADRLSGTTIGPRSSPWFGYAPFDPAHLTRVDGLLHIRAA